MKSEMASVVEINLSRQAIRENLEKPRNQEDLENPRIYCVQDELLSTASLVSKKLGP
jgi:hypothetical protein